MIQWSTAVTYLLNVLAGEIAEQREKRLESAEPQGGFERIDAAKLLDGQAFANGDSERVHGHGHANKQNLNEHSW